MAVLGHFSTEDSEFSNTKRVVNAAVGSMVVISIVAGVLLAVSSMRQHQADWAARFPKIHIKPKLPQGFYLTSAPLTPHAHLRLGDTVHPLQSPTDKPHPVKASKVPISTASHSLSTLTQTPTFRPPHNSPAVTRSKTHGTQKAKNREHRMHTAHKPLPPLKQLGKHLPVHKKHGHVLRHGHSKTKRKQPAWKTKKSWRTIQKKRRQKIQKHMQAVQKITHQSMHDFANAQDDYVDKDVDKDGAFRNSRFKKKPRRRKVGRHARPTKKQAVRAMKEVEKITGQSRKQIVEDEKTKTEKWLKNLKGTQGMATTDATTAQDGGPHRVNARAAPQTVVESARQTSDAKVTRDAAREISHYNAGKLRAAYLGRLGKARARALQSRGTLMHRTFTSQHDSTEPADTEEETTPDHGDASQHPRAH
jgi:hypothetical protein